MSQRDPTLAETLAGIFLGLLQGAVAGLLIVLAALIFYKYW